MNNYRARVGLARHADRRQNIYRALDLVRDDVTPLIREQVMLKPNFLSGKNQLASSMPTPCAVRWTFCSAPPIRQRKC